jgi:hemerythrin-like domain-containing protein
VGRVQATDLLKEEHNGVKISLRVLEQLCAKLTAPPEGQNAMYADDFARLIEFFKVFVDKCHHAKEEEVLFPALVEKGDSTATELIQVLLTEHAAGRKLVTKMAEALTKCKDGNKSAVITLCDAAGSYDLLLTDHIAKEDRNLYPIADVQISTGDQKEMVEVFEKIETERIGAGTHEKFHSMLGEFKQKYLEKIK